jgi:hypothetical protein
LSDVVWAIRKFQPDVIINRFDHRTSGTTHGHHTASAQLSVEAFDIVNNATVFPEQLKFAQLWQPKRIFFNTSWWFYGSKEKFEKADKSNLNQFQLGVYYQNLGKSNQEIAALSRSRHQSQGFGSTGTRGDENEYLEFLKGDATLDKSNIFDGIDTSWNRLKDGKPIFEILVRVEKNFDFRNPAASVGDLVKAYQLIDKLDNQHWKEIKLSEIKKIIAACSGLYLEAVSESQEINPGSIIKVKLEAINRSNSAMNLLSITSNPVGWSYEVSRILENNKPVFDDAQITIPLDFDFTAPYWLQQTGSDGMYRVDNQENIGVPDVIRQIQMTYLIEIDGVKIPFERHVIFKTNDDVKGEVYQPLDVTPQISSAFTEDVYIFNSNKTKLISLKLKAGKDQLQGKVKLEIPDSWKVTPTEIPFSISRRGEEQLFIFEVTPSKEPSEIFIKSSIKIGVSDKIFDKNKIDINYNHIYKQMLLKPAQARAIKLDIKIKTANIAYIMGAGDAVPKSLLQMGYNVTLLKPLEITTEKLKDFDVVITGIRAYNILTDLSFKQQVLFDFVKNGKTMIVQYNTTDDLVTKDLAPFPLKISRDRVTEEDAEVRFLAPEHSVLNYPNKITSKDFEGWKQEQGLYYPAEYDANFSAILSANDKGEKPKNGALLVAKYGKGNYIYTGLSFFRELPEGVIGAYRLMANLIAIGQ